MSCAAPSSAPGMSRHGQVLQWVSGPWVGSLQQQHSPLSIIPYQPWLLGMSATGVEQQLTCKFGRSFSNFSLETQENIIPVTSCASFLVKLHGVSCHFQCCTVFQFLGSTNQLPKSCFGGGMGSFSTALHPAQTRAAICCNSHKTELKGPSQGYCPGCSVLPILDIISGNPAFWRRALHRELCQNKRVSMQVLSWGSRNSAGFNVGGSFSRSLPCCSDCHRDFVAPWLASLTFFCLLSSSPPP